MGWSPRTNPNINLDQPRYQRYSSVFSSVVSRCQITAININYSFDTESQNNRYFHCNCRRPIIQFKGIDPKFE